MVVTGLFCTILWGGLAMQTKTFEPIPDNGFLRLMAGLAAVHGYYFAYRGFSNSFKEMEEDAANRQKVSDSKAP
jgi:hypothetical protein